MLNLLLAIVLDLRLAETKINQVCLQVANAIVFDVAITAASPGAGAGAAAGCVRGAISFYFLLLPNPHLAFATPFYSLAVEDLVHQRQTADNFLIAMFANDHLE